MIVPRRINANTKEIIDSVFSSQMADMDAVLTSMAKIYLAIGGDPSLSWDKKTEKLDIVRDLEQRIDRCLRKDNYQSESIEICHKYGEPGSAKPYNLVAYIKLYHLSWLDIDNIKQIKNKRLFNLLRQVLSLILHNPELSPTNSVDITNWNMDYWEESEAENNDESCGIIETAKKEVELFESLFPNKKFKRNRIERLLKIKNSIQDSFTEAQHEWFDKAFEFLDLVYSGSNTFYRIDEEDEDDGDNDRFTPETMFLVSGEYLQQYHLDVIESDYNCGIELPRIRVAVNDIMDINYLSWMLRIIVLLDELLEGGNRLC